MVGPIFVDSRVITILCTTKSKHQPPPAARSGILTVLHCTSPWFLPALDVWCLDDDIHFIIVHGVARHSEWGVVFTIFFSELSTNTTLVDDPLFNQSFNINNNQINQSSRLPRRRLIQQQQQQQQIRHSNSIAQHHQRIQTQSNPIQSCRNLPIKTIIILNQGRQLVVVCWGLWWYACTWLT